MQLGRGFVRDDDGRLDALASAHCCLYNLFRHLDGREHRDQNTVTDVLSRRSQGDLFDGLPKIELRPISRWWCGNVMLDAGLPQADVRQPELFGELYHWSCPNEVVK